MTYGSLFTGIGGIDLGLDRAGLRCLWQVEADAYCRKILAKHWPNVRRFNDVRYFLAGKRLRRRRREWAVDLVCGGFPCQDISYAGKGAGLAGKRSGLWYEFARVIRLLRPRYVLVENVSALLTRGLDAVLGTLAAIGYDAEWHCISAAAVGAPHIRDRVFVLGHANGPPPDPFTPPRPSWDATGESGGRPETLAHAFGKGLEIREGVSGNAGEEFPAFKRGDHGIIRDTHGILWGEGRQGRIVTPGEIRETPGADVSDPPGVGRKPWPGCEGSPGIGRTESASCGWWESEPDVGRVAHGVPARVDRLRGLGNAVVPQVAQWIGEGIMDHARGKS